MGKEKLEKTIEILTRKANELADELIDRRKELEDVNKPTITESQLDIITDSINNTVSDYMSSLDSSNFELELSLEYDNKIEICSVMFESSDELSEDIMNVISSKFKTVKDKEEKEEEEEEEEE